VLPRACLRASLDPISCAIAKALSKFHIADTSLDSAHAVSEMKASVDDFLTKVGAYALEKHESELDNI